MSRRSQRVLLVVTAADREAANRDVLAAVPDAGAEVFLFGLVSASGPEEVAPTHYVCSWQVTPEEADALTRHFGPANTLGRRLFRMAAYDGSQGPRDPQAVTVEQALHTTRLRAPAQATTTTARER